MWNPFKKKPDKSILKQALAAPSLTSSRSPYSAMIGEVTPEFVAMALRQCENGMYPETYLALAERMEEADAHYRSVLGTRKMALTGREILVEAASNSRQDKKIAEFVRSVLCVDEFADVVGDQQDALGKGFSVCEILWDMAGAEWRPAEIVWRDPRYFGFTLESPQWPQRRDGGKLYPLEPFKFIVHLPKMKSGLPLRGGLARCAAWATMAKSWTLKDWLAFSELFGMPLRIGKYPTGADPTSINTLADALAGIGSDFAAVIPETMIIEFVEHAQRGSAGPVYKDLAEFLDKQVSKAVLGQTETADATPGRLGNAGEKADVREDILRFDARQNLIANKRDLVLPLVVLNYGEQAALPAIRYNLPEAEERELLTEAVKVFVPLGWKVDGAWLRDKFGVPDPEDNAELLGQAVGTGSQPDPLKPDRAGLDPDPTPVAAQSMHVCPQCLSAHAGITPPSQSNDQGNEGLGHPSQLPLTYAGQMEQQAAEPMKALLEAIRAEAEQADSLEALRDRLLNLYADFPVDDLREVMSLGFALATLAGRWQAGIIADE